MASKRIDITIDGKDKTAGAYTSAAKGMQQLSDGANKAGKSISDSLNKGTSQATSGFSKLGSSASSTFSMIKAGASAASDSIGGMGNALASVIGGYSALQAVQMAWTGATQRQFNESYLRTKMAGGEADKYLNTIQKIVAEVPGSDTWMNSLLTGALARQTTLTEDKLRRLGVVASKYVTAAQQTGAAILPVNAERELTAYIKTGNTGLMVRDGILKNQMDKLQGIKTVDGRILALEEAMTEEGYMQIDTLSLASSKWEVIKGNVELAATNVGMKLLPFVEKVLNFILMLDEKTNGWSTTIAFVGAAIVGLGIAMAPIVTATATAAAAMRAYRIDAEKATVANATNKGPGVGGGVAGTGASMAQFAGGLIAVTGAAIGAGAAIKVVNDAIGGTINTLKAGLGALGGAAGGGMVGAALLGEDFSAVDMILGVMGPIGALWFTISGFWGSMASTIPQIGSLANGLAGAFWGAVNSIRSAFWTIPGAVYGAMQSAHSIAVGWARSISSTVSSIISSAKSLVGMGPAGARGPGVGLHYENYAGHKKNAWNAAGTGLSGNCVDMTLGLMSGYGGSMVQGTWNGGPHVWWRSPSGQEMDPARKALEGTWTPPARGPGDGNFGNIIIQGDVYGFDDFKRKVEKANASIGFDAARF